MPYDQVLDFAPLTRIGMTPNIILVHPSVPFKTVKHFVDYAKANPGKLSYSAALIGTSPQLTMDLLKLRQAPINISNVPIAMGAVQSAGCARLRSRARNVSRCCRTCRRCRNPACPTSR